jgi:elongation factor 1 alpha-like protein
VDGATGEITRQRPRVVPRGATADVAICLTRSMALEVFAECQPLGRVALRERGATVAVGVVTAIED